MTRRRGGAQVVARPAEWSHGPAPAWVDADLSVLADFREVRRRVANRPSAHLDTGEMGQSWIAGARDSAVLIPLIEDEGRVSVVLTRRADHLRNHAGEVSFPGGRMEPGESPWDTALREAEEEIALDRGLVTRVGELSRLTTFVSNSLIMPVVGAVDGRPVFVPHPGEVSRVLVVPLTEFVRDDTHFSETWTTERGQFDVHFFHLEDETVWGATARMINSLIHLVTSTD